MVGSPFIILALVSIISVDAQNEMIGAYVKSPMLKTFENQRTFTYSELLALSLQQSDNNACDILFERCGSPRTHDGAPCLYRTDFRPLASTVTVPVLFFVGNKDRAIGPDSYKDIHFPNAIIRIGNCGHFPFLESPKEWAAALDDYSKICSSGIIGRLQYVYALKNHQER